jgi:hypothetical protein
MISVTSASVCTTWSRLQSSKHIPLACQETQVNLVLPSRLTVGGSPASIIASAIRRDRTLTAKTVVPVNSRLRAGLRTLARAAGRGDTVFTPLVGTPTRPAAVPPPRLLKLLLTGPTRWISEVPPAGHATYINTYRWDTLVQEGTQERLLFCSKVCKPVQESGSGICVSLLI